MRIADPDDLGAQDLLRYQCRRTTIFDKIRSKIEEVEGPLPTPCWVWQGGDSGSGRGGGYPRMSLNGGTVAVHRVMFTNEYGYIPPRKQIDHLCKNRMCCNPLHLEMVTHRVNQKRRVTPLDELIKGFE
jgi:hypothetical protein